MTANKRYELLPGFLLGFHGTDKETAEKVLAGKAHLKPSKNDYDWLGHGIYFWEYGPARALEFATQSLTTPAITQGAIKEPAVIGAIIDPGLCLNMLESSALEQLRVAHSVLEHTHPGDLPKNTLGEDLKLRHLDCAVIEFLHAMRELTIPDEPKSLPYDTVRGAFFEGGLIYPNAGFHNKSHVQICVRNTDCIKGYFRVIE